MHRHVACTPGAGFTCDCDYGFGGERCDRAIDVEDFCAASPCANGDCINTNDGAECRCAWGWGGERCDVPTDVCEPDPCVNGACARTGRRGRQRLRSRLRRAPLQHHRRLNDCAVELPSLEGGIDNGDGTFTARGPIGFNGGTRLLPFEGTDFVWDDGAQQLTGLIGHIPLGIMGYLTNEFGLPGGTSLHVRVRTDAEVNAAAPIRGIPIANDREVLGFTADAAGASFTLPGTTEPVGLDEASVGPGMYWLIVRLESPDDPFTLSF